MGSKVFYFEWKICELRGSINWKIPIELELFRFNNFNAITRLQQIFSIYSHLESYIQFHFANSPLTSSTFNHYYFMFYLFYLVFNVCAESFTETLSRWTCAFTFYHKLHNHFRCNHCIFNSGYYYFSHNFTVVKKKRNRR